MVRITVFKDKKNEYVGFEAFNHANFSEAGTDIICAAVSMLVMNTIHAIETFTQAIFESRVDEEACRISFQLKEAPCAEVKLLLDTMVLGLQSIEDNAEDSVQDAVDIIFEEV